MNSTGETTVCKNCSAEVSGNFCSNCGQKVSQPFTLSLIIQEFVSTFFNLEKGFFFTAVQLFIRPGKVIAGYLAGERKKYQHPLSYLLLSVALVSLSLFLVSSAEHVQILVEESRQTETNNPFLSEDFNKYINILLFGIIPFMSLFTWLFFKSFKYNYAEHLIINAYILAQVNLLNLFFAFVIFICPFTWALHIETTAFFIQVLYMLRAHFLLFNSRLTALLKSFLSFLLSAILITLLLTVIVMMVKEST